MKPDNNTSCVLGVDVGGTKVNVGYVTQDGHILQSHRYPMDRSTTESTLKSIHESVSHFLKENTDIRPVAVGLGLVGKNDPAAGIWVRAVNLPIASPVPMAKDIQSAYGYPAFIDNDVYCATHAEIAFGAGKRYKNFLVMNVGTGLSVGIVSGGRLVRGAGNMAGEAGQCAIGLTATSWRDDPSRTLEHCSSGGGMIARAKEALKTTPSALSSLEAGELHAGSIFRLAREGDPLAKQIADDAINALCEASSSLVTILNPSALVLAGSVVCSEGVLEAITKYVHERAFSSNLIDLKEICLTALDARTVGLLGAAQRAWQGLAGE